MCVKVITSFLTFPIRPPELRPLPDLVLTPDTAKAHGCRAVWGPRLSLAVSLTLRVSRAAAFSNWESAHYRVAFPALRPSRPLVFGGFHPACLPGAPQPLPAPPSLSPRPCPPPPCRKHSKVCKMSQSIPRARHLREAAGGGTPADLPSRESRVAGVARFSPGGRG